jgi:hypothetical protein
LEEKLERLDDFGVARVRIKFKAGDILIASGERKID